MIRKVKIEIVRRAVTCDKLTFIVGTFRPIADIKKETYKIEQDSTEKRSRTRKTIF